MSEQPTSTEGDFVVALPVFSGPFRLLADLILEQKVDVCDVPVASVTDAYLARSNEAESWTLEEATWFLAICAILLELKVGRLMPRPESLDEEDLLGGSPDLAYARSIELAAYRRVAAELTRRLEEEASFHTRDVGPGSEFSELYPDVMEKVTAVELASLAAALLRPAPALDLSHVTPIRFTISDAMESVRTQLGELREADFRQLVADCHDRIEIVVRFLALLELYREGRIEVNQADTFGELIVRWAS